MLFETVWIIFPFFIYRFFEKPHKPWLNRLKTSFEPISPENDIFFRKFQVWNQNIASWSHLWVWFEFRIRLKSFRTLKNLSRVNQNRWFILRVSVYARFIRFFKSKSTSENPFFGLFRLSWPLNTIVWRGLEVILMNFNWYPLPF